MEKARYVYRKGEGQFRSSDVPVAGVSVFKVCAYYGYASAGTTCRFGFV